jgi:MATE family multidrug resistance protein
LLDAEKETELFASSYFAIRIWAAPATLALYGFYGWFIGVQNARYPMIIAVAINILNVVLSYIFIYIFNMNSDGAALGTVLAQYFGLFLAIIFILSKYKNYFKGFKLKFNKFELLKYTSVNINIFIRTLGIMAVFTFFTGLSANKGTLVLDTNTILFQFYIFFSYFIDGFAYATEALAGKYLGEKNKTQLIKSLKLIFKYGFIISTVFSLIYMVLGVEIIKLMTSQEEIINLSQEYLFWSWILPLLSFASFIWDGAFVGMTASKEMRNTMLFSSVLVFFPSYYLLQNTFGNHALWIALILFLFSRGLSQTLIFGKILKSKFP